MLAIGDPSAGCTVVVTADGRPEVMPDLRSHAAAGLDAFVRYPGFVGGALHVSNDGTRLVQYLQWTDRSAYVAARDDPAWDELESTRVFMDHVAAGRAVVDARVYEVVRIRPEG